MDESAIIRTVGGIEFDVTVSEIHDDRMEITSHPVQVGANISDHAYKLPEEVTLVVGKGTKDGDSVPRETYDKLLDLQKSAEPFDIVTGKREYKNMLIRGITVSNDADTDAILMATLDCVEVILVETANVTVRGKGPTSRQKLAKDTQGTKQGGEKQAQQKDLPESTKKSIARSAQSGGTGHRRSDAKR